MVRGTVTSPYRRPSNSITIVNTVTSNLNEKIAELEKILNRQINIILYSLKEYEAKKRAQSGFTTDL